MPEKSEKSLPTLASELWDLVRAYAKQETIEPLKGIGRFIGFGLGAQRPWWARVTRVYVTGLE